MDDPSSPEGNAITLRIKFKSASLDEFVARYGADVSAGGIFIRTRQPLAVGALLRFDFSLADGSLLLAGMGTVVWIREPDPSRAGSIPGMGLRFDQLAPESQQTHQQILAAKSGRGDRASATPPQSFAAAPPARAPARPATPPPIVPRPAPAAPVAAPPSGRQASDAFDEFGSSGKTEIADRPPSFYFDSSDSARGAPTGTRQEAAPAAPLEDTETDSQSVVAPDSSWSEPIDIGEDVGQAGLSSGSAAAQAAAGQRGGAGGAGDELAAASLDLPPADSVQAAAVTDLVPPSARGRGATAGEAGPDASSGKPAAEQGWLDRAMKMPDGTDAAPVEASAEHTEEVAAPPEAMQAEAPAPASGEAKRPARQDEGAFEQDLHDQAAEKPAGQGKKLIVVGIVAAGLAFAGVYLLQAKPWQSPAAPAARPAPVVPAPPPVAPPPRAAEPSQAAVPPKAAEAEPVKPAENVPAQRPTEAPAKTKPEVVEAAKPDGTAEAAKHRGSAAGSAKKTASKLVPSPPPSSPAPAGQDDTVYLLKVRSVPPGAQVLIDGEPMGQTPFQRRILDVDKSHAVTIRKPGYESYERNVSPSDAWAKDGNTEIMNVTAKLKKSKAQAAPPSAESGDQSAPVPEQPEKL